MHTYTLKESNLKVLLDRLESIILSLATHPDNIIGVKSIKYLNKEKTYAATVTLDV